MPKPLTVWITTNWKIPKRWEYQTTLPASWETWMPIKKQQLELDMEKQTGLQIGKWVPQGCVLSPYLFNLYAEYITRNPGLDEAQGGIKIAGRNIKIHRWHHLYSRRWRRSKEPLDENEEKSEKVGLKLNIQKTKIMASGTITSWQIDGETVETVADFILRGSKITADVDCSHEVTGWFVNRPLYYQGHRNSKRQAKEFSAIPGQ